MLTCGLGSFSIEDIDAALLQDGVALGISGFRCLIRSDAGLLAKPLHLLYQDYPASLSPSGFFDLNVSFCRQRKGWRYSEVAFYWEDDCPFPALPIAQTHPLFEWGLNWGIATASGAHIVIHAAVVERHGAALVLPGQPGAGKSTLCADLVLSGWRLLSDELTIISRKTGLVQPLPRPISLKESSISLIRERYPDAVMSESVSETRKGEIAFLRPPAAAVSAWQEAIPVGHVIFPKYAAGEDLTVIDIPRSQALTGLLEHSFNVGLLGNAGFTALANVVAGVRAYEVTYGNATEIKEWIEATCR